jgi:hypothetical protein
MGDRLDLMDYATVTGGFRRIVLPPQIRGEFAPDTGVLVITSIAPEPSTMGLLIVCFGSLLLASRLDISSR